MFKLLHFLEIADCSGYRSIFLNRSYVYNQIYLFTPNMATDLRLTGFQAIDDATAGHGQHVTHISTHNFTFLQTQNPDCLLID
jgi:hypothetical protein